MEKYVHGVKISDVKRITGASAHYNYKENEDDYSWSRYEFDVEYKDEAKQKDRFVIFNTSGVSDKRAKQIHKDLKMAYNEYNNVPDIYVLENGISARINGESIDVGCRCINNLGEYIYFTNKELDKLRSEFKIKDEGWRHLAYIQAFEIEHTKVKGGKIEKKWIDQLEYMGYNISKLEYTLEQDEK